MLVSYVSIILFIVGIGLVYGYFKPRITKENAGSQLIWVMLSLCLVFITSLMINEFVQKKPEVAELEQIEEEGIEQLHGFRETSSGLPYEFVNSEVLNFRLEQFPGHERFIPTIEKAIGDYKRSSNEETIIGRFNHGLIITGPDKNRKRRLARAIAKEIGSLIIQIKGGDFADHQQAFNQISEVLELTTGPESVVLIIEDIERIVPSTEVDQNKTKEMLRYKFLERMSEIYHTNDRLFVIGTTHKLADIHTDTFSRDHFQVVLDYPKPDEFLRYVFLKQYSKILEEKSLPLLVDLTKGFTYGDIENLGFDLIKFYQVKEKPIDKDEARSVYIQYMSFNQDILEQAAAQQIGVIIKKPRVDDKHKPLMLNEKLRKDVNDYIQGSKNQKKKLNNILIYGPIGTLKLDLAIEIANELERTAIIVAGSSIVNKWNGSGSEKVKELFQLAEKQAPSTIIISQIESMDPKNTHDPYAQLLTNQLVFELEQLRKKNIDINVIVTTNGIEKVADGIVKSGFFRKRFFSSLPDEAIRTKIIGQSLDILDKETVKKLITRTKSLSQAEIIDLVEEIRAQISLETQPNLKEIVDKALESMFNLSKSQLGLDFDLYRPGEFKAKFADFAGLDDVKAELRQNIDYLKNPKKYKKIGATLPKGLILYGPPGTGKTFLARIVASEADVPFISVSGSSFVEEYVGVGAARMRQLFETARQYAPCVIFIDEVDAFAGIRNKDDSESASTLNQFLSEMDNINANKNNGITVIAATNRIGGLDSAFIRPGRFDKKLYVRLPNPAERTEILRLYLDKYQVDANFDTGPIVASLSGFSGADIRNLVNEAALQAVKNNRDTIETSDIEYARTKILIGRNQISKSKSDLDFDIVRPGEFKEKFTDFAGLDEVKDELRQSIDYMRNPEKYKKIGATTPKGLLLYGPPGTGKTFLARIMAGEANVPFLSVTGSNFVEKYVGVGAARMRQLFETARQNAPCIVFIDEVDAFAQSRDISDTEGASTLNQFLSEMDNVNSNKNTGITIIAATNRINKLDPAFLRPGRFDKKLYIRLPNQKERTQILKLYLRKYKANTSLDVNLISGSIGGFSGADIKNLVNEAALQAIKNDRVLIEDIDIEYAKDNIILGLPENSKLSAAEKKRVAYHEAGHTLVGLLIEENPTELYKVTVGIRDGSLGGTHFTSLEESQQSTKQELINSIAISLGGKIAEQMIYGEARVSNGASSDLNHATSVAQDMVTKWGMGSVNNNISYDALHAKPIEIIHSQIEEILSTATSIAEKILKINQASLEIIAKELMVKDELTFEEVKKLIAGQQ